jgi:hypothetical protein
MLGIWDLIVFKNLLFQLVSSKTFCSNWFEIYFDVILATTWLQLTNAPGEIIITAIV